MDICQTETWFIMAYKWKGWNIFVKEEDAHPNQEIQYKFLYDLNKGQHASAKEIFDLGMMKACWKDHHRTPLLGMSTMFQGWACFPNLERQYSHEFNEFNP